MYLKKDSESILKRSKHLLSNDLSLPEFWFICYLGTDLQSAYANSYIEYLKGTIDEKNDIFKS